ncbi:MAG: isochorismate synthase [Putridiphycobacter sp.]
MADSYVDLSEVQHKNGFVFHSFNSQNNFFISNLEETNWQLFEYYHAKSVFESTSKHDYLQVCKQLIADLKQGIFSKVVLSKLKVVPVDKQPEAIFKLLNEKYTNTFNYLISIEGVGTWIGATPETLLDIKNKVVKTVSLAGTKLKETDPWGAKELEEQQFVTDFIEEALLPHVSQLTVGKPETIKAGKVYHLKTNFKGILKSSDWTNLVSVLHPTPATCGIPKQTALAYIEDVEAHERAFYTGFLGEVNQNRKSLMVNLRCMQIQKNKAVLYLGGGITKDSDAQKEWEETENKALTILNVIND